MRKKSSNEKVRVTLDLSRPFYKRLTKLGELVDSDTKASVIRDALQLYEYVATEVANGSTFSVVDRDGRVQNLVFFSIPKKEPSRAAMAEESGGV